MNKRKLDKANAIHEREQQIIGNLRAVSPTVQIVEIDADGMHAAHTLVDIETVVAKCRWVCSCGQRGILVGCAVFDGRAWATLAHDYHAALNLEGDHVHA